MTGTASIVSKMVLALAEITGDVSEFMRHPDVILYSNI